MLQLKHIHKVFNEGSLDEKIALDGIHLEVEKGDFITIIGSNGAGKSTLLNIIAGKLFPDEGEVWLDGVNITTLPEHKRSKYIGRVFQNPLSGTSPTLTIEENLAIAYGRVHKRTLARGVTNKRKNYFEGAAVAFRAWIRKPFKCESRIAVRRGKTGVVAFDGNIYETENIIA
ncbi:ABC-type uncharacterized transport system ATPase component [Aeribacillus sp. SP014]